MEDTTKNYPAGSKPDSNQDFSNLDYLDEQWQGENDKKEDYNLAVNEHTTPDNREKPLELTDQEVLVNAPKVQIEKKKFSPANYDEQEKLEMDMFTAANKQPKNEHTPPSEHSRNKNYTNPPSALEAEIMNNLVEEIRDAHKLEEPIDVEFEEQSTDTAGNVRTDSDEELKGAKEAGELSETLSEDMLKKELVEPANIDHDQIEANDPSELFETLSEDMLKKEFEETATISENQKGENDPDELSDTLSEDIIENEFEESSTTSENQIEANVPSELYKMLGEDMTQEDIPSSYKGNIDNVSQENIMIDQLVDEIQDASTLEESLDNNINHSTENPLLDFQHPLIEGDAISDKIAHILKTPPSISIRINDSRLTQQALNSIRPGKQISLSLLPGKEVTVMIGQLEVAMGKLVATKGDNFNLDITKILL
ncbi:MAG: FliM/FliN family flagellar motor switch protein [SAR324 cluster bacterium]|nr:FliM/FliN family flagellar motor switch protein [SAR324 cluster bacterium]